MLVPSTFRHSEGNISHIKMFWMIFTGGPNVLNCASFMLDMLCQFKSLVVRVVLEKNDRVTSIG